MLSTIVGPGTVLRLQDESELIRVGIRLESTHMIPLALDDGVSLSIVLSLTMPP